MDPDVFQQFIEQLQRYVTKRLIPAERMIVKTDAVPAEIVQAGTWT